MKSKVIDKRLLCCVLSLILVLMCVCSSMQVHASSSVLGNYNLTSDKLVDMCLTRSGKVVNADMRQDIVDQVRNVLNGTATSYKQWLEDNDLSNTTENFRAYLESDAYASLTVRFVALPLEIGSFISWITTGMSTLDQLGTDIEDVLTETDESGNVTVPTETVNIINQCFNDIKSNYENDVYYVDTYTIDELPTSWFQNQAVYTAVKNYINTAEYPSHVFYTRDNNNTYLHFINQYEPLYLVTYEGLDSGDVYSQYYFKYYNGNWDEVYKCIDMTLSTEQWPITGKEDFETYNWDYSANQQAYFDKGRGVWNWIGDYTPNIGSKCYIFTKDGSPYLVYKSLDAVKNYSQGKNPYYMTNRQYSDSVDNSFNVSGEYISNNGGTFAYEQIREQINNSNVTNDNSVSEIVNDYSQTIINNYYGSGGSGDNGSGDGTGNDDSGNNSILDGLGSIISAITDIIGFLLGAIGDVVGLVGDLFKVVYEGIKALGAIFSGFSMYLGEIFVFVPQTMIDFLVLAVESSVALAIWKKFSK